MIYQHYKGGRYKYITTSRLEADGKDGEEYVTYQSLTDGSYWTRPLSEWKQKFTTLC